MRANLNSTLVLAALSLLVLGVANTSHFPPWTSFHAEAPAFLASGLVLVACVTQRPKVGAGLSFVGVLVAVAWAQFTAGMIPHAGDAWVATAYLASFAAAWLGGAAAASAEQRGKLLNAIYIAFVVMGLLAAFQCLVQWTHIEDYWSEWVFIAPLSARSVGNYGQPNQTATLLLMAIAATGALMVQARVSRMSGWALLLLLGWGVVLTQSRTGLVSVVVLVVGLVALSLRAPALRPWRWHAISWLVFMGVASALLQVAPAQGTKGAVGAAAMVAVGLRPVLWTQLLIASIQEPWTGFGWLQVSTAQQLGALSFPGIETTNYAHNVMLDLVVMLGIPLAATMIIAAAAWLLRRAIRLWERRSMDGTVAGALFVLVPLAVHAQLELPHAYAYFLVPAGLLLGLFDAATREESDGIIVPAPVVAACAAALIAMLGVLGYEYSAVEEDFRVSRFENRRLGETPEGYLPPNPKFLTQLGDVLAAMRLRAKRDMPPAELETLVRASRRYTWAPLQFRTALALGLNGRPEEAARHLEVITHLFPGEIVREGRDNWDRLQRESYPELRAVKFPGVH